MHSSQNSQLGATNTGSVSAAFEHLIRAAKRLLLDVAIGMSDSLHFDEVNELLATVPLTTAEHVQASLRLRNAMQYAAQGETGAARYEITLFVRNFSTMRQTLDQ